MLLNITDVLTTEGKSEEKRIDLDWKVFPYQGREFPVAKKEPVLLKLINTGHGKAELSGRIELVLQMQCDRCLEDVPYTFDISFVRQVCSPEESDMAVSQAEETEEEVFLDQKNFMDGCPELKRREIWQF